MRSAGAHSVNQGWKFVAVSPRLAFFNLLYAAYDITLLRSMYPKAPIGAHLLVLPTNP